MLLADLLWAGAGLSLIATLAAAVALIPDALDARADRLQHSDPGTAAALRRARAMTEFGSSEGLLFDGSLVACTPTRRNGITLRVLGDDEESEHAVAVRAAATREPVEVTPRADVVSRPRRAPATTSRRVGSRRTRRRPEPSVR